MKERKVINKLKSERSVAVLNEKKKFPTLYIRDLRRYLYFLLDLVSLDNENETASPHTRQNPSSVHSNEIILDFAPSKIMHSFVFCLSSSAQSTFSTIIINEGSQKSPPPEMKKLNITV